MKAVVLYAAIGALLAQLLTGCHSAPPAEVPKKVLSELLYYAEAAESVTVEICTMDRQSRACQYLVAALDAFYSKAVVIEEAMNAGEDVSEQVRSLRDEVKAIWSRGVQLLRGAV